jgi:hypothetical protein
MQVAENAMFHRHLVAAYIVTWALQLGYLAYVLIRRRSAGKSIER